VTLISSLVIGVLGWSNGRRALENSISNQLTSIRAAQAYQIEAYFQQIFSQTRTLAENRMVVNAMQQFNAGFQIGLQRTLQDDQRIKVREFYTNVFAEKLAETYESPPLAIMFEPKHTVADYFQYHYLVENPFPAGQKDMMTDSETDGSIYSKFHKFYQPLFRNLLLEFSYYDIFLIDIDSLSIVYSVFKETDFATSLLDGPYQDSGLGTLANRIKSRPMRGEVTVIDYSPYAPSYGAPAAFVGSPIYDGNEPIGVLAIQISADEINKAMTYDKGWSENGLGETGESYLVGADKLMRSDARQLLEKPEEFLQVLENMNLLPSTVRQVRAFNTSNTLIPVANQSVSLALERGTGTHVSTNYIGQPVLSSYAPLRIPGLDWVIVSEMTTAEAFRPVSTLQRNILIWGVVLILIVALLSMLVSRIFVRPIDALTEGVAKLGAGDDEVIVEVKTRDEFGVLADNFNTMVASIRDKSRELVAKDAHIAKLVRYILPPDAAEKYEAGEQVADRLPQVTIASLHFTGISDTPGGADALSESQNLETIFRRLDEMGEDYEVDRANTIGTTYVTACGLNRARLDHTRQMVAYCRDIIELIDRFNLEMSTRINVKIGIAAGQVTSAVFGSDRLSYEVWGEAVDLAARSRFEAEPGQIIITEEVKRKVESLHDYESVGTITLDGRTTELFELIRNERSELAS
jgi:class 3 adenylate cyclase